MRDIREELDELAAEVAEPAEGSILPATERELHPGDRVRVASLRMEGTIVQAGPTEVEVQVGRLRVRVGRGSYWKQGSRRLPLCPSGRGAHRGDDRTTAASL